MIAIGHWNWHGFGFFTLARKGEDKPLGRVGLLKHSDWPEVELAWHLFEGAEGFGYATEAAQEVQRWAHAEHGLEQLVSYIDTTNTRSQAVAQRLGATTDHSCPAHEPEAEVWTHVRMG